MDWKDFEKKDLNEIIDNLERKVDELKDEVIDEKFSLIKEIKRIFFDLILAISLLLFYLTGFYNHFDAPIQLIFLKVLLVSMGFIHAHILRKIAFRSVNWDGKWTPRKVLIICLYIVIIYCYSMGG